MINRDNIWHVYPINDEKEHNLNTEFPVIGEPVCKCECLPIHEKEGEGLVIVHNSFDGREGVEWVSQILNSK
jgi:hypothetical protein